MKKYLVANWKMNVTETEVVSWFQNFKNFYENPNPDLEVIICPSFVHLKTATNILNELNLTNVSIGSQDVSAEEKGAYSGQVSASQLKDFCTYTIVGHSETKSTIEQKIKKAFFCTRNHITPIICFTEPQEIPLELATDCIIAWEDPSNISKNGIYNAKDPADIEKTFREMKKTLGANTTLLYGGSVNEKNAQELANNPDISGAIIGNASLNPQTFCEIIKFYYEIR